MCHKSLQKIIIYTVEELKKKKKNGVIFIDIDNYFSAIQSI